LHFFNLNSQQTKNWTTKFYNINLTLHTNIFTIKSFEQDGWGDPKLGGLGCLGGGG
jgi:hypothetical protein